MSHSCLSSSPGPIPLIVLVLFPAFCPHHLPRGPQDTSVTLPALSSHTGSPSQSIFSPTLPKVLQTNSPDPTEQPTFSQHHAANTILLPWLEQKACGEAKKTGRQDCEHRIQ